MNKKTLIEGAIVVVASAALAWTGGVAHAVSLKSSPESAPTSCKSGPVSNASSPNKACVKFWMTTTAPKTAPIGPQLTFKSTFHNTGASGMYEFRTQVLDSKSHVVGGVDVLTYSAGGTVYTEPVTFPTAHLAAGKYKVVQTVLVNGVVVHSDHVIQTITLKAPGKKVANGTSWA